MAKSSTPPHITDLSRLSEAESYACMQNIIKFGNRSPVLEVKHLQKHVDPITSEVLYPANGKQFLPGEIEAIRECHQFMNSTGDIPAYIKEKWDRSDAAYADRMRRLAEKSK